MDEIVTEDSGSVLRVELNRPAKENAMTSSMYLTLALGEVVGRIDCEPPPNPHSFASLRAKKKKLGQTLTLHMECVA